MLLDNRQFLLKKLGGGEANVFNSQGKQKVQVMGSVRTEVDKAEAERGLMEKLIGN